MPKNIVIPLAGEGSRFRKAGIHTPKPLMKICGEYSLLHSINNLPVELKDHLIFICLKRHKVPQKLRATVEKRFMGCEISWIEIDEVTAGQLCTVLEAKDIINRDMPMLVHNCDTVFQSHLISLIKDPKCDGALSCVQVEGDHWSFAKVDDNDVVVETAEKVRISEWASVGAYYFRDGRVFVKNAEEIVAKQQTTKGEYYIAPMYNDLIKQGNRILLDRVTWFKPMGTPQDLIDYWGIELDEIKKDEYLSVPTIVFDLDGTLCSIKTTNEHYSEVTPKKDVIEKLKKYKEEGFRIIIQTARNMRTFNYNAGQINKVTAKIAQKWLDDHEVPYDEIYFGKPWGQKVFYVDDKAIRPDEFLKLDFDQIQELISQ